MKVLGYACLMIALACSTPAALAGTTVFVLEPGYAVIDADAPVNTTQQTSFWNGRVVASFTTPPSGGQVLVLAGNGTHEYAVAAFVEAVVDPVTVTQVTVAPYDARLGRLEANVTALTGAVAGLPPPPDYSASLAALRSTVDGVAARAVPPSLQQNQEAFKQAAEGVSVSAGQDYVTWAMLGLILVLVAADLLKGFSAKKANDDGLEL